MRTFRSLRVRNYRIWAAGAAVSNVGTWMQRMALDWLVLTGLTHHDATALGVTMSLQFGPHVVLLPWTGLAADRLDRRRLLMGTQGALGAVALLLGVLTTAGVVRLWEVWVLALLQGCVTAFDSPARQVFVAELVGDEDLPNAIALNSTSFNAARMVGPAVAGLLIARVGSGPAFEVNAASFGAVLLSLAALRVGELHPVGRLSGRARLLDGLRYVRGRPDLMLPIGMLFVIGTFGLNFSIFISTMCVTVFRAGAQTYGWLSSCMAVGTVIGALGAARRLRPDLRLLRGAALLFGVGCTAAAVAPDEVLFGAALVLAGMAALTVTTATNSLVQLGTEPAMRGRVMAIRLAVALGGTPVGAPIVGWIAKNEGPRWALAVGAAAGFIAAALPRRK